MTLLKKMPKVDLHFHLAGSAKPQTLKEIARDEGIKLPVENESELQSFIKIDQNCKSLTEYLTVFDFLISCMQSKEAIERIAYEAIQDVSEDNVKYIEVRFAPKKHTHRGLKLDDVIQSVLNGLKQGEKDFGTTARALVICMRDHQTKDNIEVVEAATSFMNDGVVGIDMAGDESKYPLGVHKEVFKTAKRYGIPVTIHAGEAAGADSIKTAVLFGARRIGHGVRLKEDRSVLELVKRQGIALEMCPTSNYQTKAVSSLKEHPIREYYLKDINVTANTDNTVISDTTMTNEYRILKEYLNFSDNDLLNLTLNAVKASFLSNGEKEALLKVCRDEYNSLLTE